MNALNIFIFFNVKEGYFKNKNKSKTSNLKNFVVVASLIMQDS